MGLDMFLYKKIYIGANYNFNDVSGTIEVFKNGVKLPIKFDKVVYIEESAMTWRKANAIHDWFVNNVQDGNDDCGAHDVSLEKLRDLLDAVDEVLEDHDLAELVLPTSSGFFFGGTDYDEYYFEDLEETKKGIEEILADPDTENFDISFTYTSSW